MDSNKIKKLDNQIQALKEKLCKLQSERDKVFGEKLYNLVGRCFKNVHESPFEIIKVNEICNFGNYTLRCKCLKHSYSEYTSDTYFIYDFQYDIPLYSNINDSIKDFNANFMEISEEDFNILIKESFYNYLNYFKY